MPKALDQDLRDHVLDYGIAAPYVFDGPINAERFLAWV